MYLNAKSRKLAFWIFITTLILDAVLLGASHFRVIMYNNTRHQQTFEGQNLFYDEPVSKKGVTVEAVPRESTWGKIFDFNHEGITENNYQAYTYDFSVSNNTNDEVSDFLFKLTFNCDVYLSQAWNGALEIHQHVNGEEKTDTIPDMRDFHAEDYNLDVVHVDGETMITMEAGDYFVYEPSTSMNAVEMPIEPKQGTSPGLILYVKIGESIENSSIDLEYSFHRKLTSDPLFWASIVCFVIWILALFFYLSMSAQARKYARQHDRDNELIKESIETFIGFIDAKDPYTNGHSKRVALYTEMIARELGYSGEELNRIYYIALLHDCGKIGIPDNILRKPGKLTDEEYKIIQSHTTRGSEILKSFKSLENVGEGARLHHERYDGKGYPEGLKGEEIPLIARIICVADSFDAMNSNRVYRHKLKTEHILNEIEINKGKQFDPKIAEIMLKLIREGKIVME